MNIQQKYRMSFIIQYSLFINILNVYSVEGFKEGVERTDSAPLLFSPFRKDRK